MARFVALLRGVNVGKGNRVAMADLKQLLERMSCTDVATLLNSGNVVFSSSARSTDKIAISIAAGIEESFGFKILVVVKSSVQFKSVVRNAPVVPSESAHSRFLVAFASDAAALQPLKALVPLAVAPERFVVTDEAAYLYSPDGILESKVGEALVGKAGKAVTTRNWATALKICDLLCAS
jgi:uncharacterized protein (DUF1697 family)